MTTHALKELIYGSITLFFMAALFWLLCAL